MRRLCFVITAAFLTACGPQHAERAFSERVTRGELIVAAFGSSAIELDNGGIVVQRIEGPANAMGVQFTLGPRVADGEFAATFSTRSDGHVSARVGAGGEFDYREGGGGILRVGHAIQEFVLYSDDATWLEIEIGAVYDCKGSNEGPCFGMQDLRREIFPDGEPEDTHEHLLALLDWAANHADHTSIREVARTYQRRVSGLDASTIYSTVYQPNRGAGICGAHASFLAMLLRDFGYDAMTANYGILDPELTHVTTLVYNPFGSHNLYLLDPTFNAHIVSAESGQWASFDRVLGQPAGTLRIVERPMPQRDFLFPSQHDEMRRAGSEDCRPAQSSEFVICRRPVFGLMDYLTDFAPRLAALGLSATAETFIGLFRSRYFSIGGGSPEARAALVRTLHEHGLSLQPPSPDELGEDQF